MIKRLSKHGDELALVIDRSLLEKLGIDETTPLEISIDGPILFVAPARADSDERFAQLMESISQRYAKTFKRLADEG